MTTESLEIPLCGAPVRGSIRPPGSKSITNRALVCAALARGTTVLTGVLDSQDTRVMADGLMALGIGVAPEWDAGRIVVEGGGGTIPAARATLDCAASGTTIRFLAAVCALGRGTYRLDGTTRMRKRPIGDLLEALRSLGTDAIAESAGDCPPVELRSHGLTGGQTTVRGGTSSQFASALAMIAPCTAEGMTIDFAGRLVSLPYLEMTRRVMADFGAACHVDGPTRWSIPSAHYAGRSYAIEPDASAASYFLAAAAITGGSVTVEGLSRRSMQGDVEFAAALERMGCGVVWHEDPHDTAADSVTVSGRSAHGIDIDMNAISDTVPTLGVVALFADGPTTIRNVAHIRDKETDRIGDLARELSRLGARIEERQDGLTIHPAPLAGTNLATYDDHRMAMSLSLAGLVVPGVRILDPRCTAKTFPGYWQALAALAGFEAESLDAAHWPAGFRP